MAFSTIYDVKVRYSVDNRAGRAVGGLAGETRKLGSEVRATTSAFGRLGTIIVGTFGARAAGKALLGFNSTVEDTKLQIAGMLALARKKDLTSQLSNADRLFGNLQRRAALLPGTTMEYARMAGMITQPIIDAGLTMKDLEDLTINSVVAAKALGIEWQVAARDIDQALRGQFHSVDVFSGKLLGSLGYKGEEGRARFNAMNADKRAAELHRALTQPQIAQLGAAQGQTFAGVISTLQDTIQQTLGKVGLPLFQAITKEVKEWNKWIDANRGQVNQIAHSIGEGLVKGFGIVKDALGFLVANADTLLMIGKVWLGVKIGGMLGGGLGSGGAGLMGSMGAASAFFARGKGASDSIDPFTGEYKYNPSTPGGRGRQAVGGFGGAMGNLPLLGQSLAVGYAVGTVLNNTLNLSDGLSRLLEPIDMVGESTRENAARFEELRRASVALKEAMERAANANPGGSPVVTNMQGLSLDYTQRANLVMDTLRAQKAAEGGGLDEAREFSRRVANMRAHGIGEEDIAKAGGMRAFADQMMQKASDLQARQQILGGTGFAAFQIGLTQLTDYQRRTLDEAKAQQEILMHINQQIAKGTSVNPTTVMEILRNATMDPEGKHKAVADKPKVNITIQRIEVQSDDPDRMAFGLIESLRDAAKNPSSAAAAIREG